jgi:prepilin-type N-terminal cleavage/methylation domain-containing protein
MFNIRKNKKGFTLIELSIVLIIIGLLVAGIVAGSNLIDVAKLSKAQSLTKASPVGSIKDLVMWVETTLDESYSDDALSEGDGVAKWKNYNKQKTGVNLDNRGPSTVEDAVTPLAEPKYTTVTQTGLPMLDFDSSSFELSPKGIASKPPFTFFFVFEFDSLVGGNEQLWNVDRFTGEASFRFMKLGGYSPPSFIMAYGYTGESYSCLVPIAAFSSGEDIIIRVSYEGPGEVMTMSVNGGSADGVDYKSTILVGQSTLPLGNIGYNKSGREVLGTYPSYPTGESFNGKMGEFIVYHRALGDDEIDEVEGYLAKKWDINLRD